MMNLLRLWFGLRMNVSRKAYVLSGVALMALKVLLDNAISFAAIGKPWPLMAYLLIASLRSLWKVVRPATLAPEHPREPAGRRDPDCTSADQHVAGEEHPREAPDGGTVALATSPTTTLQPGCHQAPRPGSNTYRLATLSDFAMTFGMFWMSTGLLLPILPLLAVLSF